MPDGLKISDAVLEAAASHLVAASRVMIDGNQSLPAGAPATMTGAGEEIARFVTGLSTGRLALADAAKTASTGVAGIMSDSSDLDARLAGALYTGFAVRGTGR